MTSFSNIVQTLKEPQIVWESFLRNTEMGTKQSLNKEQKPSILLTFL